MSRFSIPASPMAHRESMIEDNNLRINVLTDRLLRVEKGAFCDAATQTVWNRAFDKPVFSVEYLPDSIQIETACRTFRIDRKSGALFCTMPDGRVLSGDSDEGNLLGTARTLDFSNGPVRLEKGLMSRSGLSCVDDSNSLIIDEDGELSARKKCSDRYYFAYGSSYRECLRAFFSLTGAAPLIPKFALGNWWSRYKAYTQEEYKALMQEFINRGIPISVATIDMDWHWTDVIKRFGPKAAPGLGRNPQELLYGVMNPGWTGYSWNTELFPDHRALLKWLHEQGFAVTLNVHPSQGVRFFEDSYEDVCRSLKLKSKSGKTVAFDIADKDFRAAYFDALHHPLEDEGVDFWWIDWQQGKRSSKKGLDPLWALNHYHSLDSAREGKRPLILSRYAGLGSHRYPLGFSGDTVCSWESLAFQPYFTATAANSGYTWWSHDIGGHCHGIQDDELYIRWLQLGVFSPINRLHSTNNECMGKEPWKRGFAARVAGEELLRLRHRLIPYLYSMNYLTHTEGRALCEPMYYSYDLPEAYEAENQYFFGTELMVCPITTPGDKQLNLGSAELWLPEGRWTDIFNGRIYEGPCHVKMHRDIDSLPVLAKEGCILPMYSAGEGNSLSSEQGLDIRLWRGSGSFKLYEDDGRSTAYEKGEYSIIPMSLEENGDRLVFKMGPYIGEKPVRRPVKLIFEDVRSAYVLLNGVPTEIGQLSFDYAGEELCLELSSLIPRENQSRKEALTDLFTRMQGVNSIKSLRLKTILKDSSKIAQLPRNIRDAVMENMKMKY